MSNFYTTNGAAFQSNKNDWETPQKLFDELNEKYHFTLDPCSNGKNAKCEKYFTEKENGLIQSWEGETVFVNPPYGRTISEWVKKCSQESKHAKILLLIPTRTDTKYFHQYIYRQADIEFLQGRLKFEQNGKPTNSAPFPSMIVKWGL